MRVHAFFFGVTVTLVSAAAAMQACGGDTSSSATTPTDAGGTTMDVANDVAKDTGPGDTGSGDSATCDLSADFTKKIPDASLADGASTTGVCIGCLEAHCKSDIDKCNLYCPCQTAADKALSCFAMHSDNPILCAGTVAGTDSKTQGILLSLAGCLQASCGAECPVPDGGLDGGGD
jgi:hypothetical protein